MRVEEKDILYKKFKAFYHKNAGDMIFFARKYVSVETAEDIVHDIFLKIWDTKSTIVIENDINNYLFTMVRNACLDHLKSQSVAQSAANNILTQIQLDEVIMNGSSNDYDYFDDEFYENVYTIIEKLPDKQKQVFEKSYLKEQKHTDIAKELNISVRTVETHIYKALKFLRKNINIFFY